MARHASLGIGLLLLVSPFLAPSAGWGEEPEPAPPVDVKAKAIQAWGKTCQRCHAVPDTRFETDRAFLRQIMETT